MKKEDKKVGDKKSSKEEIVINPPELNVRPVDEHFSKAIKEHFIDTRLKIVLEGKAAKNGVPLDVVETVFLRGIKDSKPSHLTFEQHAMNRVNSFLSFGEAFVLDCDLIAIDEKMGTKGTGGGARPHIKREKNPYNNTVSYHVVDSRGRVRMTTSDPNQARRHLSTHYDSMFEEKGVELDPAKRLVGTTDLVKLYRDATPGQEEADIAEASDAYKAGFSHGSSGQQPDRRASAKYGPNSNDYHAGYSAGTKAPKPEKKVPAGMEGKSKSEVKQHLDKTQSDLKASHAADRKTGLEARKQGDYSKGEFWSSDKTKELRARAKELSDHHHSLSEARIETSNKHDEFKKSISRDYPHAEFETKGTTTHAFVDMKKHNIGSTKVSVGEYDHKDKRGFKYDKPNVKGRFNESVNESLDPQTQSVVAEMRRVLATAYALQLKAQSYHWNVQGADFVQYHEHLGDIYEFVYAHVDKIAEQIRTLDAKAIGSFQQFEHYSRVKLDESTPAALTMLATLADDFGTMIDVFTEAATAADAAKKKGLVNYLEDTIDQFNKQHWMLKAIQNQSINEGVQLGKANPPTIDELFAESTARRSLSKTTVGRTYVLSFTWRGMDRKVQMFYPSMIRPSRENVQKELKKTFPDAILKKFDQMPSAKSIPMLIVNEEKEPKLNKPFRTPDGPKKFSVFVKNAKGNTQKVNFGDPNMEIKRDDPERRKAYRARHNCDNPGPKTKANYWSCKNWGKKPVSK